MWALLPDYCLELLIFDWVREETSVSSTLSARLVASPRFSLKISPTELISSHGDMLFELNPKLKGLMWAINKWDRLLVAGAANGGTSTYLRNMRRYCECESERFNLRDVAVRNRQSVAVISGPAPVRPSAGVVCAFGGVFAALHSFTAKGRSTHAEKNRKC